MKTIRRRQTSGSSWTHGRLEERSHRPGLGKDGEVHPDGHEAGSFAFYWSTRL